MNACVLHAETLFNTHTLSLTSAVVFSDLVNVKYFKSRGYSIIYAAKLKRNFS